MASVNLKIENNIAYLELNRPDKLNAINKDMIISMLEALEEIENSKQARVVVLSGAGDNFCSGLDILSVMQDKVFMRDLLTEYKNKHNKIQHMALGIYELDIPVIASIDGYCFGGGLQMAMAADIRICSPNSSWSILEGKWGIIADMGISITARGRVREDILLQHSLLANKFSGDYAVKQGFATQISNNPKQSAIEIAEQLLARSPDFMRSTKKLYRQTQDMPILQRANFECELQKQLINTPNQLEAVKANLEKRQANFSDTN